MNTEEKIIDLLTDTPQLRDDDNKLIASIWSNEMNSDIRSRLSYGILLRTFYKC